MKKKKKAKRDACYHKVRARYDFTLSALKCQSWCCWLTSEES